MRLACLHEVALYTEGRDAGFFLDENRGRQIGAEGTARHSLSRGKRALIKQGVSKFNEADR